VLDGALIGYVKEDGISYPIDRFEEGDVVGLVVLLGK
jgi:hypothetical protein